MFVFFAAFVSSAFLAATLFAAWRAVQTARTPQGAVGWVVFLLSAPYIALLCYLFLGHHRYRRYLVSRRKSARVMEIAQDFAAHFPPGLIPETSGLRAFEEIAALQATGGNHMHLLIDGDETFDALFAAIDGAERYVLAQFFIIHDDALGRAFQEKLIAAAQRGVKVRLLFDPIGSRSLPKSYLTALRDAGVETPAKRALNRRAGRFQINYRNHRKTLIVDGLRGFTGGLNVGDEYMGRNPAFGHWRDTFVALSGPIVTQLQLAFSEDWHWATDETLVRALHWDPVHNDSDMAGLVVSTGPADDIETGALFYLSVIVAARRRLWIASPYFVPDTDVLSALKQAAMRGVDVRVLVPEAIDHKLPWLAAHAVFDDCRAAGVQIWRYQTGFMHQKALVVDSAVAAIGTMNMDNRSFRLNFETMAMFFDENAANEVATMLEADFQNATLLTKDLADQPLWVRIGAPVSRLFAPLL